MKTEKIKNQYIIDNEISSLQNLCSLLENNLNRLELFNRYDYIISKDFIFELTLSNRPEHFNSIVNHIKKHYPLHTKLEVINKVNDILKLLFTESDFKDENNPFFKGIDKLPALQKYLVYSSFESELKDSFIFDFVRNEVIINPDTINKIIERNTFEITDKKQLKMIEIIREIERLYKELNYYYNNDLAYELFNCFVKNNNEIEINMLSVYQKILSKYKQ